MRAVAWAIARLPWAATRALGAALGALAGGVLRIRRREAEAALARAGIAEPRRTAARVYASLGTTVLELLWLAGRPPAALDERFAFAPGDAARLDALLAEGRGLVVATAHTGNWDLAACAAARWLAGRGALHVVTKRLSWRALDRFWQRLRAERGVLLHDAAGAVEVVRAALAAGEVVALLVDQAPDPSRRGLVAPFLGADARHDLAPAVLAARARAPIAVVLARRAADGTHRLAVVDVIAPEELRGPRGPASATRRVAAAVERFVLDAPDQWLWLHRRWKPGAEAARS
jgi:KDO2-lipid IV(A) lauroyltransferase